MDINTIKRAKQIDLKSIYSRKSNSNVDRITETIDTFDSLKTTLSKEMPESKIKYRELQKMTQSVIKLKIGQTKAGLKNVFCDPEFNQFKVLILNLIKRMYLMENTKDLNLNYVSLTEKQLIKDVDFSLDSHSLIQWISQELSIDLIDEFSAIIINQMQSKHQHEREQFNLQRQYNRSQPK